MPREPGRRWRAHTHPQPASQPSSQPASQPAIQPYSRTPLPPSLSVFRPVWVPPPRVPLAGRPAPGGGFRPGGTGAARASAHEPTNRPTGACAAHPSNPSKPPHGRLQGHVTCHSRAGGPRARPLVRNRRLSNSDASASASASAARAAGSLFGGGAIGFALRGTARSALRSRFRFPGRSPRGATR